MKTGKRNTQECTLSLLVFNVYIQEVIYSIRDRTQLGIKVNGPKVDMLRFSNNITTIKENEKDIKIILGTMEQVIENNLGMKMNTKK